MNTPAPRKTSLWPTILIGFCAMVLVRVLGFVPGLLVMAAGWAVYAGIMYFVRPRNPPASAQPSQGDSPLK